MIEIVLWTVAIVYVLVSLRAFWCLGVYAYALVQLKKQNTMLQEYNRRLLKQLNQKNWN